MRVVIFKRIKEFIKLLSVVEIILFLIKIVNLYLVYLLLNPPFYVFNQLVFSSKSFHFTDNLEFY